MPKAGMLGAPLPMLGPSNSGRSTADRVRVLTVDFLCLSQSRFDCASTVAKTTWGAACLWIPGKTDPEMDSASSPVRPCVWFGGREGRGGGRRRVGEVGGGEGEQCTQAASEARCAAAFRSELARCCCCPQHHAALLAFFTNTPQHTRAFDDTVRALNMTSSCCRAVAP